MKYLTNKQCEDISRQMSLKGRDIDVCMLNIINEEMPKSFLLDCLTLYINKDGGYGHGLHIDNYNTNSSVYQVYEAFRLLRMLDFTYDMDEELYEMVVNKPMNFLYNKCELKDGLWFSNAKTNNDFAHADLFTYNEENRKLFGVHPTVALVGYTLVLCKPTKAYYKKALKMSEGIINDLLNRNKATRYELNSYNSFLMSIRRVNLFTDLQPKIEEKLVELAEGIVMDDFTNPYLVRPMEVSYAISSPKLDELKNKELDFIIDSIAPHGLWNHNLGWGTNKYAEEDSAMLKWIGAESVNNYYLLKKYGRIA